MQTEGTGFAMTRARDARKQRECKRKVRTHGENFPNYHSCSRDTEVELGNPHENAPALVVDSMKTAMGHGIAVGNMIAVIGKVLARIEAGCLAHDLVAFDHQLGRVSVFDDPFAPQQRDGAVRPVLNGQIIDEGMGLLRGKLGSALPIDESVKHDMKAGEFFGSGHAQVGEQKTRSRLWQGRAGW